MIETLNFIQYLLISDIFILLSFYNRFSKQSYEFSELDQQLQTEINNSWYSSILPRIVKRQNNNQIQNKKGMRIADIVEGQSHDGSIYTAGANSTLSLYKPPPGCPFSGKLIYDCRCRKWFLQSIKQDRITPIEPTLLYGDTIPFYATTLCKTQRKYEQDKNGNMVKTNCTYSANCLSVKLSTIENYFTSTNFNISKTIMIDPRSEIVVYNQQYNFTQNITRLINATIQLFPNDTQMQNEFLQQIRQKIQRKNNVLYNNTEYKLGRLIYDEKNECEVNPFKVEQQIHFQPINFGDYASLVSKVNLDEKNKKNKIRNSESFILKSGQEEEVFVTLDSTFIVEKLLSNSEKKQFEIQDLFIIINILPKKVLTSQTDVMKEKIKSYLVWVSISSLIMCGILIVIAGVMSYQVAVMIEKPLIHMTQILNILNKEGCEAAIDFIDSEVTDTDLLFLSKDFQILFESFKRIISMIQVATEEIFSKESNWSLLKLNYQINFFKEFNNYRVLGICFNNMGNIHFQNGRYFESMEAYQNSIILAQQEGGVYLEQEEKGKFDINQSYLLDEKSKEYKNEGNSNYCQQANRKSSFLSSRLSKKQRTISTSLMNKKKDENPSTDHQLNNSKEGDQDQFQDIKRKDNKSKYKNISDSIQQIIFDRKLNFSHALYMHNITQEVEMNIAGSNISNRVLNNPINSKKSYCTLPCISSNTTMLEWEIYEIILLDLVTLNQEIIPFSFSRSVLLLTQLSLCHLKMDKIEQASNEQSLAIDHYQSALSLEQLLNKGSLTQERQGLSKFNIHTKVNDSIQIFPFISLKESIQLREDSARSGEFVRLSNYKEHDKFIEEINDQPSLDNMFRSRQLTTKKLESRNQEEFFLIKDLQSNGRKVEIEKMKENQDQILNETNKKILLNPNSNTQNSKKMSISSNKNDKSPTSALANSTFLFELNQKLDKQYFCGHNRMKNSLQNSRSKKTTVIEKEKISNRNKIYDSSQSSIPQRHSSSKTKNSFSNQRSNKQLKNDFQQQQRYELPHDILLYYLTLQESRLLILENHKILSAFILTDLLEKSKFYLPYYRLACLNVLSDITNHHQQIQSQINKLKIRFDSDIQFNVSIAVTANSNYQEAFHTIINLVNNIFIKDDDILSLLLYEQNNFEDIIPSISLKQLRLTGGYLEQLLEKISQENNLQRQFPIIDLSELPSSQCIEQSFENQNQPQIENKRFIKAEGSIIQPLDNHQNKDSQFLKSQQFFHTSKNNESNHSFFSQEAFDQNKTIQQIPQLKYVNTISQLYRGEQESLFIENSPIQYKILNSNQKVEKSPLKSSRNNLNRSKEDTTQQKIQSLVKEESKDNKKKLSFSRALEMSGTYLLQSLLKKEQVLTSQKNISENPSLCLNLDSFCVKSSNESKIKSSNATSFLKDERMDYSKDHICLQNKCRQTYDKGQSEIQNPLWKIQDHKTFNDNLIFHLAIRKCIINLFNQDSNKLELNIKLIQRHVFRKQRKFIIFIADSLEIINNQVYQILFNFLYSIQTKLLILLLNKGEHYQLEEHCQFKDIQINGKSVIRYFHTSESLIKYIRNKREPMKNFGVPLLFEYFNL